MKLIYKIITVIVIILMQSGYITAGKGNEAKQYYQRGVRYYIKRDFKKATKEFLQSLEINPESKKSKQYMHKAQDKYYKALSLFFKGINYFIDAKYNKAAEKFRGSLFVNPLDERAIYYLKLCYTPVVSIKPNYKIFKTSKDDNKFFIDIDTKRTIPNWVEKWEFKIEDRENKIIRKMDGEETPPGVISWDLKNDNDEICSVNKVNYYLVLTSLYGRVIKTRVKSIIIDNDKQEWYSDKEKVEKGLASKKGEKVIKFAMASGILFDYNSTVLKKEAKEMLDPLIEFLKQNKRYKIKLSGYTDNIGSQEFNLKLSKFRALSVKIYLTNKGIKVKKIRTYGYGKKRPAASNKTEEGREKNRRVEFKLSLPK